jgi:hypothetical protein
MHNPLKQIITEFLLQIRFSLRVTPWLNYSGIWYNQIPAVAGSTRGRRK